MEKRNKKDIYSKIFILSVCIMIAYRVILGNSNIFNWLKEFMKVLSPLWASIALAYLLYIPSRELEKKLEKSKIKKIRKHARGYSVTIVYLVFFILVAITIRWLIPFAIKNIRELIYNIPEYLESAKNYFIQNPLIIFGYKIDIVAKIGELQKVDIYSELSSRFSTENIFKSISQALGFAKSIIGLLLVTVLSIHVLLSRDELKEIMAKFSFACFGKRFTKKAFEYIKLTNYMVFKYVTAQLLDAVVISTLMSIAFTILKVKYAIPLAILIGISNLIPYFAIIGVGLAIIITIFTGGFKFAFIMATVTTIIQQIDANIINPYLVGRSLETSPIVSIMALVIATNYFGPLGIFLSVPILRVILIIIYDLLNKKVKERKIINITRKKRKIKLGNCKYIYNKNYKQ